METPFGVGTTAFQGRRVGGQLGGPAYRDNFFFLRITSSPSASSIVATLPRGDLRETVNVVESSTTAELFVQRSSTASASASTSTTGWDWCVRTPDSSSPFA